MKYFSEADAAAEELANVLIHNKYLLNDVETLKSVLFSRFLIKMGDAHRDGKDSIIVSDISSIVTDAQPGAN